MADEGTWVEEISSSITEAINVWMSHVTIETLDVTFSENIVKVNIVFSVIVDPGVYSDLTLNFDSERGDLVYPATGE